MIPVVETRTFNRSDPIVEGWYWALPSRDLPRGRVRAVTLAGREIVLFRGEDGAVGALDAYCPHMGAHLAEGRVEGNGLRCFFHHWKYDRAGRCVDVPCMARPVEAPVRSWPTEERYGLVWIWTGETPRRPIPFVPELEGDPCDALLGNRFVKNCHPNVVMINAIDAQHFNSVHRLPVHLEMEPRVLHDNAIQFSNTTSVSRRTRLARFISRFYRGALTYSMCYWFGSTGSVTLGPDFFHFHILFALRPGPGGTTEGQTVLLTRRRRGVAGALVSRVALLLTRVVGDYFAQGDTRVFQTIRFDFRTPVKADLAIVRFIQHVERQPAVRWGTWERVASPSQKRAGAAG